MKKGRDIAVEFPGLYLVHQNVPGKKVGVHSHESEHLVFLPLQGEIKVLLDKRQLVAGPGRLIYLPANTQHGFDSSSLQGERLIAIIQHRTWKKAAGERGVAVIAANQLCKEILFYLLLNPQTKNSSGLIQTFIHTLDEAMDASCEVVNFEHLLGKIQDIRIERALEYFEANFSESISMEHVAKAAGLSTRNMNRLFTTELGLTPKQVLTHFRIARAKELLLQKKTVTHTAFEVGYQSLAQFIAAFRQLTGLLPSDFLK